MEECKISSLAKASKHRFQESDELKVATFKKFSWRFLGGENSEGPNMSRCSWLILWEWDGDECLRIKSFKGWKCHRCDLFVIEGRVVY